MSNNNSNTLSSAILDACDVLTRASAVIGFLIGKRTREDNPGKGWIMGTVEDAINEAIQLLETAQAKSEATS